MPEAVRGAGPSEFHSGFYPGKLGMFAHGNFQIGLITNKAPDLDFGITFIPGLKEGEVSSFAGGDVMRVIDKHHKRISHVHTKDVRMGVIDKLYPLYGDQPTAMQGQISTQGNAFLKKKFPSLDAVLTARVVSP